MSKSRFEIRLEPGDVDLIAANMKNRGIVDRSQYVTELVRNDNPFSKSKSQSLQQLTGDVSGLNKKLDTLLSFFIHGKKNSFLTYQVMVFLLSYFADVEAKPEGLEKAQEFIDEKAAEFERFYER